MEKLNVPDFSVKLYIEAIIKDLIEKAKNSSNTYKDEDVGDLIVMEISNHLDMGSFDRYPTFKDFLAVAGEDTLGLFFEDAVEVSNAMEDAAALEAYADVRFPDLVAQLRALIAENVTEDTDNEEEDKKEKLDEKTIPEGCIEQRFYVDLAIDESAPEDKVAAEVEKLKDRISAACLGLSYIHPCVGAETIGFLK